MDPSRHRVDAVTDGIEVGLAVDGEVRALGDVAADQAIEGLVRGPLPQGRCGSAKKISIRGFTASSA